MITHVAIIRNGIIYSLPKPNRHHDIFPVIKEVLGESWQDKESSDIQGFVDYDGRFMNREEAYLVARQSGQLNRKSDGYAGPKLFSEDIW